MDQPLQHVVIIGCGLLGTSLGLALRKHRIATTITGVGRHGSPSVATALQRGAIHRATDNPADAIRGTKLPTDTSPITPAQLVIVCTPVRQFPDTFRTIAPALAPGTFVTDVGSTKAQVMQWAAESLPAHATFIGSHPMAGSEKSGPDAAREDLYQNAVCLICPPTPAPAPAALRTITQLWTTLGMRLITCNPQQHDQWVAAISHLPHAVAAVLFNTVARDPAALQTAAGGFIDTTRIASGDVTMWTDILLTNRQAAAAAIGRFTAELSALQTAIKDGDEAAIRTALESAKNSRDAFMQQRRPASAPLVGKRH